MSSRLRKPLVKLVEGQANTSAQRNACIALGYIARVDSQADKALDRLWSNQHSKDVDGAIERGIAIKESLSSLSSSDGESRSGDDELTDSSAVTETGTVGDTKVFDESSSAGGTLNYCPNCGHNLSQQDVRRFCGACGYKLS